jgi:holo-[acyl-carrier protein] synthase
MLQFEQIEKAAMHKVGVDIIEISRIDEALQRFGPRFLHRIFTQAEIILCKDHPNVLAVRFAGKEAVMKALGTGVRGVGWREIEILAKPSGEPVVTLYGKAKARAGLLGLNDFAISLSHSREYAVASVVAV